MKVSVIVPNYNHEAFLRQRLNSVYQQSFQDFEVILLDDASTDNSVEVLKEYETNPKTNMLVINTENSGSPFRQWQKGISQAKGEYIWIAESDDFCELNFLETLIGIIEKEDCVLAYCDSAIVDDEGKVIQEGNDWMHEVNATKWKVDHVEPGSELVMNYLRYRNIISNASSVVFRKDVLTNFEFDAVKFKTSGDWLLWIRIALCGNVGFKAQSLNFWRYHETSTRSITDLDKDILRMEECSRVIETTFNNYPEVRSNLNKADFNWLIDWWIRRFSYRNLFNKGYILAPIPGMLRLKFYFRLTARTFKEIGSSLKRRVRRQ